MSNETVNVFDQEEIIISVGSKGLDVAAGTYHAVVWGVISYQQRDFKDKTQLSNAKCLVVQLPTEKDDKNKPQCAWAYSSDFLTGKSKFAVYLKGIYGESIESNHPIRLENGNIDPKKLFGKNCLVSIANISKVEGEVKMGITGFSPLMKGLQELAIDTSVEMPKYLIDLKNGKYLNDNHQEEAPAIPQGAKTAPAAESPKPVPPVPPVPVTTTAAATVETEEAKAKRTRKPKEEAKPAAVAEVAKPAVVAPAGPFKTFWRVIDGVQQTCPECGERQYIYNAEGKWTCKGKHSNIPSKESLLDDAPPADEDMAPTDADNITA